MTELVKVKSEVHKLMNKVESANKVIQDSGREVCTYLPGVQTVHECEHKWARVC